MLSTKKQDIHKNYKNFCMFNYYTYFMFFCKLSTMQGLLLNFMRFLIVPTLFTVEYIKQYTLNAVKIFQVVY